MLGQSRQGIFYLDKMLPSHSSDTKERSPNIASLLLMFERYLDTFTGDKILCFLGEKQTAFLADDFLSDRMQLKYYDFPPLCLALLVDRPLVDKNRLQ